MTAGLRIERFYAGYPKRPVIQNLNVPLIPRGKITVLLGRMAVVNQPYCAHWQV